MSFTRGAVFAGSALFMLPPDPAGVSPPGAWTDYNLAGRGVWEVFGEQGAVQREP